MKTFSHNHILECIKPKAPGQATFDNGLTAYAETTPDPYRAGSEIGTSRCLLLKSKSMECNAIHWPTFRKPFLEAKAREDYIFDAFLFVLRKPDG